MNSRKLVFDMNDGSKNDLQEVGRRRPQKKKLRFSFSLLVLALLAVWMVSVFLHNPLLPNGSEAPDFRLQTAELETGILSLGDLKGKTVVLDFWGTGCPPCMQEMFELEAVWNDLKDKNVVVVGVSSWGESRSQAFRMKQRKKVTYPFVVGTPEMISTYKVDSLPTLYIIDPEGKIAHSHLGFWDRESLKEAVLKL